MNVVTLLHRYLQGITTYQYVVAMRAQSDPPGPSVHDDQQSLASSPMSSAPTAFSGGSFARHYKGAWCTPPRIFIDQVSIVYVKYFWAISTFLGIIVLCLCSIIEGTTVFSAVYSFNFNKSNKSYQKFTVF